MYKPWNFLIYQLTFPSSIFYVINIICITSICIINPTKQWLICVLNGHVFFFKREKSSLSYLPIVTIYKALCFFLKIWVSIWFHFSFNLQKKNFKAFLVVNFFSFSVVWKVFILPLWLKDVFTGYRVLNWQLIFSFSALKILSHCVLISLASGKKSMCSQMVVPLLAMCHVSLAAFEIFSSMLLSSSLTMMCAGGLFSLGGWGCLACRI